MLDTPVAGVFAVSVPLLVAEPQFMVVIVPTGKITFLDNVHVFPPIFTSKLAVPSALGVPEIS